MLLTNSAAWIPEEQAQLEVGQAPWPKVGDDDLIISTHAVAVNPVDWKIQSWGGFGVKYPYILGEDVAGVVVEVGANFKHKFRTGQRVIGHASGLAHGHAYGAFQKYPLLRGSLTAVVPDEIPLSEAVVLPLSISTSAAGLYTKIGLHLRSPGDDTSSFADKKPTLLVWGGSSSVGSSVIQLAVASGYTVVTTASLSNFDYVRKLGATEVADYHEPDVTTKLIDFLGDTKLVGAYDAIGSEITVRQNAAVLHALGGGKIVSVGKAPEVPHNDVEIVRISSSIIDNQEPNVAKEIWGEYVPAALASGKLVPEPKPLVTGHGLSDVQEGLDKQKAGVSASKIVIELHPKKAVPATQPRSLAE
ncbi:hypothetical protein NW762_010479 [Fusarium torreyae]|uniref:Enoyl reductase (ER) domain-containing protein n=1 Tax=Fusarium torreyae TaxID=1237075 RepID=A0A9W8RU38_9HYPO|nr:hypothetical protein NW762_010479 [Fusarium torreyae]